MAGLDGLRAVAVLAVVFYHLNVGWASGGLLGVGVFFVLSGYLITDLLLAEREREGAIALGRFWLRRARRLLPALWVMLVVVTLWIVFLDPSQLGGIRGALLAALLYFSNWWYAFQHVSYFASFGAPSPLGHLWSLAVEEQFYLVWPLLLMLALRVVHRRWLLAGLLVAGAVASAWAMAALFQPGSDPTRVYEGTDTRAFQLLIGASLAIVWPSRRSTGSLSALRRRGLDALGGVGLAVIVVMVMDTNEYQTLLYRGGMVILSLATVAVIAALAHPAALLGRDPRSPAPALDRGALLWDLPLALPDHRAHHPRRQHPRAGAGAAAAGGDRRGRRALLALCGGAHPQARVPRGVRRVGRPPMVVPWDPHRPLGRARRNRVGAGGRGGGPLRCARGGARLERRLHARQPGGGAQLHPGGDAPAAGPDGPNLRCSAGLAVTDRRGAGLAARAEPAAGDRHRRTRS